MMLSYPIIDDVSRAGGRLIGTFGLGDTTFVATGARPFAGAGREAVPPVLVAAGVAVLSGG